MGLLFDPRMNNFGFDPFLTGVLPHILTFLADKSLSFKGGCSRTTSSRSLPLGHWDHVLSGPSTGNTREAGCARSCLGLLSWTKTRNHNSQGGCPSCCQLVLCSKRWPQQL